MVAAEAVVTANLTGNPSCLTDTVRTQLTALFLGHWVCIGPDYLHFLVINAYDIERFPIRYRIRYRIRYDTRMGTEKQ
jgi:hypothetical protein